MIFDYFLMRFISLTNLIQSLLLNLLLFSSGIRHKCIRFLSHPGLSKLLYNILWWSPNIFRFFRVNVTTTKRRDVPATHLNPMTCRASFEEAPLWGNTILIHLLRSPRRRHRHVELTTQNLDMRPWRILSRKEICKPFGI